MNQYSNLPDLTGMTFNRLTVLGKNPERYTSPGGGSDARWDCICECGRKITVTQSSLKSGRQQSCGCVRLKKDLTGMRFGKLTVIGLNPEYYYSSGGKKFRQWDCICDCGKKKAVSHSYLTQKRPVKSCGCCSSFMDSMHYVEGTVLEKISPDRKLRSDNKSGINGVHWNRKSSKWTVQLRLAGKVHHIGNFCSLEEAAKARKRAEEEYFNPVLEKYEFINNDLA